MQYPYSPSLPLAYVQNQIITHNFRIMIYLGERKKNFGPIPQVINKKDIYIHIVLTMLGRDISPGLKWWQTIIFIQPMRRLDMHFGGPICLFFGFWGGQRILLLSSMYSHWVPIKFPPPPPPHKKTPMCSQWQHTFILYTLPKVELSYI
jgi:hypothetical protein